MKIFKRVILFTFLTLYTFVPQLFSQADVDLSSQKDTIRTEDAGYSKKSLIPACPVLKNQMQDLLEKAGMPNEIDIFEDPDPQQEIYLTGFPPFLVVPSAMATCTPNELGATTFSLYKALVRFRNNHALEEKLVFFGTGGFVSLSLLYTLLRAWSNYKGGDRLLTIILGYLSTYVASGIAGEFYKKMHEEEVEQLVCNSLVEQGNGIAVFEEIVKSQEASSAVALKTRYASDYSLRECLKRKGVDFEAALYNVWKDTQHNKSDDRDRLIREIRLFLTILDPSYDGRMRFDIQDRYERKTLYRYNLLRELMDLGPSLSFGHIDKKWLSTLT